MTRNKNCVYKNCKNLKNSDDPLSKDFSFIPFPKPSTQYQKCQRWLAILNRDDLTVTKINRYHYVCSQHFHGGKGPTAEFPDPLPDKVPSIGAIDSFADANKRTYSKQEITDTATSTKVSPESEPLLDKAADNDLHVSTEFNLHDIPACDLIKVENTSSLSQVNVKLEGQTSSKECDTSSDNFVKAVTSNEQYINNIFTGYAELPFTLHELRRSFFLNEANAPTPSLWAVVHQVEEVNLTLIKLYSVTNFITIQVTPELKLIVLPLNRTLDASHVGYSLNDTTITSLSHLLSILNELDCWTICEGLEDIYMEHSDCTSSVNFCKSSRTLRSTKCELILKSRRTGKCKSCRLAKISLRRRISRGKARVTPIAKINHRYLNSKDMAKKITAYKRKNQTLERKIKRLQSKIKNNFTKSKDGGNTDEEDSDNFGLDDNSNSSSSICQLAMSFD